MTHRRAAARSPRMYYLPIAGRQSCIAVQSCTAAVESGFELQRFWAPIGSWLLTPQFHANATKKTASLPSLQCEERQARERREGPHWGLHAGIMPVGRVALAS